MLYSYLMVGLSLTAVPLCDEHTLIPQLAPVVGVEQTVTSCAPYNSGFSDNNRVNKDIDATFIYKAEQDESFWDNWTGNHASPVMSTNSSNSFYGIGVWIPEKYEDEDILTFDDAKEWIKKHGLHMSFGIGGEDRNSPRFRFDYRWHDDGDLDDVFIQVEIPFQ
ncbi:hypothetical protein [Photobacterium minamisatsumaniensis]|uniref:hypothetical protein n=1 Tax=Photobacterium minamisatsumaniensis TaxID=2910233 RepID=UPI003D0B5E0B